MNLIGSINRGLRFFGVGRPLYRIEGLRVRFMGDDPRDRVLFREFIERELPYGFLYNTENQNTFMRDADREVAFRQWLATYAVGLNWHVYNPLFGQGEVRFASPEDALALRVTFNNLIDLPKEEKNRPHV